LKRLGLMLAALAAGLAAQTPVIIDTDAGTDDLIRTDVQRSVSLRGGRWSTLL